MKYVHVSIVYTGLTKRFLYKDWAGRNMYTSTRKQRIADATCICNTHLQDVTNFSHIHSSHKTNNFNLYNASLPLDLSINSPFHMAIFNVTIIIINDCKKGTIQNTILSGLSQCGKRCWIHTQFHQPTFDLKELHWKMNKKWLQMLLVTFQIHSCF